jgi:hypothetical protein
VKERIYRRYRHPHKFVDNFKLSIELWLCIREANKITGDFEEYIFQPLRSAGIALGGG